MSDVDIRACLGGDDGWSNVRFPILLVCSVILCVHLATSVWQEYTVSLCGDGLQTGIRVTVNGSRLREIVYRGRVEAA